METNRPKVWVWVIVRKEWKVLLQKRINSHWDWTWCFPGGHLEFWEQIEECARRETVEEAWITIKNISIWPFTNDIFEKENKHYITIYVISDYDNWEVRIMEPEKCEKWDWFDWDNMPENLFIPTKNLVQQWYNPFK